MGNKLDSLSPEGSADEPRSNGQVLDRGTDAPLDTLSSKSKDDRFYAISPATPYIGPMTHPSLYRRSRNNQRDDHRATNWLTLTKDRAIAIGSLLSSVALRVFETSSDYVRAKYQDTKYWVSKQGVYTKSAAAIIVLALIFLAIVASISTAATDPITTENSNSASPTTLVPSSDSDSGPESRTSDHNATTTTAQEDSSTVLGESNQTPEVSGAQPEGNGAAADTSDDNTGAPAPAESENSDCIINETIGLVTNSVTVCD